MASYSGEKVNTPNEHNIVFLKAKLRKLAEEIHPSTNVTFITLESAKEYAKENANNGVSSANINSFKLNLMQHNNHLLSWNRADSRVSKEVFVFKVNLTTNAQNRSISVEYSPSNDSSKQTSKISVNVKNVMGIQIDEDSTLTVHFSGLPMYEMRDKKQKQWHTHSFPSQISQISPCFCTIQVHLGKNKTPPDYHELFKLDEKLNAALRAGIKENYPEFTVCESRPEDVLPIVKDPELVRAAQLLVVDFACDEKATDIPWLIRQYSAVYKSFKRLLRSRLENQSSGSHEE